MMPPCTYYTKNPRCTNRPRAGYCIPSSEFRSNGVPVATLFSVPGTDLGLGGRAWLFGRGDCETGRRATATVVQTSARRG